MPFYETEKFVVNREILAQLHRAMFYVLIKNVFNVYVFHQFTVYSNTIFAFFFIYSYYFCMCA